MVTCELAESAVSTISIESTRNVISLIYQSFGTYTSFKSAPDLIIQCPVEVSSYYINFFKASSVMFVSSTFNAFVILDKVIGFLFLS